MYQACIPGVYMYQACIPGVYTRRVYVPGVYSVTVYLLESLYRVVSRDLLVNLMSDYSVGELARNDLLE